MSSFWMLIASLLFAIMALFVKLGSAFISPFGFVFFRGLFGIFIIGAWAILTNRSLKTPVLFSQLTRGVYGTISVSLWFYSLGFLPLGTGITLNYTNPLFIGLFALFACLIKKESIQWGLLCVTAIGFMGVLLITDPTFNGSQKIAVLIGLVSSLTSALAIYQIRHLAMLREPDWRTVFYFCCFTFVWGLVGMIIVQDKLVFNLLSVLSIFGIGICGTFAQISLTKAFSSGNMLLSSLLQFTGIVFATLLGVMIFNDQLSLRMILGMVVIVISAAYAGLLAKRSH